MLTLKNVLSGLFARSTFSVRSAMPARSRRLRLELLEERTLLAAVFTVNSIADPGDGLCTPSECTLREAISAANANVGPDLIEFDIPGAGPHTIQPTSALPEITDPVVIDGYTQYGATANTLSLGDDAVLQIVLDGQSAGDTDGLVIRTGGGGSTVRGLVINQFARSGIRVQSSSANAIEGNFIGTNVSGTVALGNGLDGVLIIEGASSNRVGTNSDGFNDLAERNVISSNGRDGIAISFFSEQNAVGANLIGLDVTGANTLRDARNGIFVFHSSNTTIGGAVSAARNVIADSAAGVHAGINIFDDPPSGSGNNFVLGNYIGTNAAGTAELPAGSLSIRVTGSNNVIGGTVGTTSGGPCTGACNLISGRNGIYIQGYGGNRMEGNHIGTNATGDAGLGNTEGRGVLVQISSGNTIGGTALGAGNVISGWGLDGVMISEPGHDNVVQGNFIGTDATGTVAIGNRHSGVILHDRTSNNTIGGATPGARNIISGNGIGVTIQVHSHNNTVAGNFIGTDVTGASPLANVPGVTITEGSSHNLTGGVADGASNTIAFNHQFGVSVNGLVAPSAGNAILRNSLFANGGLGIDLSMGGGGDGDGPTSNDMGDGDAGANNLQNFPVLNSVASSGGSTMIHGSLNSTPNSTFRLEFFSNTVADPSGFGEGEQYLGFTEVATNSIGDAAFTATMPVWGICAAMREREQD